MRGLTVALTLALSAGSSLGQEALGVYQQYIYALEIFSGGTDDPMDYYTAVRPKLFDGLEGTWIPINLIGLESSDPAELQAACERYPGTLRVRDPFSFEITMGPGTDTAVTTIFTSRGGNLFAAYFDPMAMAHRLGQDAGGEVNEEAMVFPLLNGLQGNATVVRPTPDILVIQANYTMPQIYGRCPD